ncbi:MAG: alpha/beta fold hydrolase [Balneolaceae bacterium]
MYRICLLLSLFLFTGISNPKAQNVPENLTLQKIFHEPVIPGIRPSFRFFSSDQESVFFSWNDSSYYDTGLYKLSLSGGEPEDVEDDDYPPVYHSPDLRKIAYTNDGDIFIASSDGSNERKIISSKENDAGPVWSPDSRKLAFTRSGDVWVTSVTTPQLIQVTQKKDDEPGFTIDTWAGNDKLVLRQTDYSEARTIYFPEYADDFVIPGETTRGIPAVNLFTAYLDTTAMDTLLTGVHRSSAAASHSGNYIAVDYADAPLKHRKLLIHDTRQKTETVVFEDSTKGWLSGQSMEFAPRSDRLFFRSEQDGWNHLYQVNLSASSVRQLTSGNYEVTWAEWKDDQSIVYAHNEADYGERHLFLMNIQTGDVTRLTSEEGYRYQFSMSPDRSKLVYAKTYFNEPYDLYYLNLDQPGAEQQITHTIPEHFDEYNWQQEEYVRFTGRNGETELSMSVLYPEEYNESQPYPVVVFVHGAGSLQNVYKGWSNNYWREYMFNQYLNKNGYMVIEVDYRHSTGYGRKFREDVTNWMGRYETIDIIDGLDWLQEKTGALDLGNVGIYGGSYGGFMALYALTEEPDRFHAGAALRKVSNWRNYYYANPWYTLPRLGDPEEVPEHYDRSSPLTYASELEHPVLLLHGLIDDNVGFQDAVQYIEELIQSGNEDFEMMMYPSEAHGFTSPDSWYDEYRRIFEFFEKHLK